MQQRPRTSSLGCGLRPDFRSAYSGGDSGLLPWLTGLALALAFFLGAPFNADARVNALTNASAGAPFRQAVANATRARMPLSGAGLAAAEKPALTSAGLTEPGLPASAGVISVQAGVSGQASRQASGRLPDRDDVSRLSRDAYQTPLSTLSERKASPLSKHGDKPPRDQQAFGLPLPALPPLRMVSTAHVFDAPAAFLPASRGPIFFSRPPPSDIR